MPEAPIVRKIKTYAFNHGCGLDEATYKVLRETVSEAGMSRNTEGLFDTLFKEGADAEADQSES